MATDPLTAAILQGLDPGVYRSLSDIKQGDALQQVGMDASPTSKWGAIGRLANAAAGTYLANSATSDLAKTVAAGKKSSFDTIMSAIEAQQNAAKPAAVPSAAPAMASPPTAPLQPAVQPSVPVAQGSPNAQVAARFPADMSPGTAASPLPNDAPSPLDTAQSPAGPVAAATAVAANAPRGIRNNNPLNIEAGDFTKSQPGFAGTDGRFAKFDTPENGLAAAHALLDVYDTKHGLNTVNGIVGRWAPGSDGNNVSAYANDVATRLGIDPNAPIPPAMRPALVAAMAQHENGVPVPGADQAPYKVAGPPVAGPRAATAEDDEAPAAAAAASALDTHKLLAVLQNPYSDDATKQLAQKLLLQQLTPKEHEFASSPQGIFDTTTGQLVQGNNNADEVAARIQSMQASGASKQQLLQALPAQYRDYTSALIEGKAVPANMGRGVDRVKMMSYAHAIDPNFDETQIPARIAVRKDFAGEGKNGLAIGSFNTVQHHIDKLSDDVEGLAKYNGDYPTLNSARTYLANNANTNPGLRDATQAVNDDLAAVSHEVGNAYNAGHLSDHDLQTWNKLTNSNLPPDQLRRGLADFTDLLNGKRNSLNHIYHQTFGEDAPGIEADKNQATTLKVHQRLPDYAKNNATPSASAVAPSGSPDRAAIEAEMRKRGLLQ